MAAFTIQFCYSLLLSILAIPATIPKDTPATGHTIHVLSHAFVMKLQARNPAVTASQYTEARGPIFLLSAFSFLL